MVLTAPLAPGLAMQVAEPLTATDEEVARVGATLATLSAIGVAVATLLGWAVAKTGLSPVARLARVAEEVSLTGDPGRRVEVGRRDELGRLATTFNAMLGALQRSLDAQRRLVSDASHELRTPLASLRINVDVLTENPDLPAAERKEVLARVTDQVAELSRLVASVTDLARGEPPATDMSPVRLNAVAADALDAARRDWPKTQFDAYLAGGVIEGSAERLRVAFKNLLDNAAKFGPPAGSGPGAADGRRVHRPRPRPRHRRRGPPVRLRPLLPCPDVPLGPGFRPRPRRRPRDRRLAWRHDRRGARPGRRHHHAADPPRSRLTSRFQAGQDDAAAGCRPGSGQRGDRGPGEEGPEHLRGRGDAAGRPREGVHAARPRREPDPGAARAP